MESFKHSLSLDQLAGSHSRHLRVVETSKFEDNFTFKALNEDPQIFLPQIDIPPVGALVRLDISLPAESMVQLFYQTLDFTEFIEENSISISRPAGRHIVEFLVDHPLNGVFRLDPGNSAGLYHIHAIEILQFCHFYSLLPQNVLQENLQPHQIRDIRLTDEGLFLKATGRDPSFLLPKVKIKEEPAVVRLDMTLQRQAMVQLYYQTRSENSFNERLSKSESRPAGRHVFEWFIDEPLNGVFRLDPGNMPWEYHIHGIELFQTGYSKSLPLDRLFLEATQVNQIEEIRSDATCCEFQATGEDPYIVFPRLELLPKPAKAVLEITVPENVIVQLFYQTDSGSAFEESSSLRVNCPAGRNSLEFSIVAAVNGYFRLDPGNLPGIYRIHKVEFLQ
jgi:hypothetical protein